MRVFCFFFSLFVGVGVDVDVVVDVDVELLFVDVVVVHGCLSQHNTAESCWFVIRGVVYDVTKFLEDHPGGDDVLKGEKHTTKKKKSCLSFVNRNDVWLKMFFFALFFFL